MRIVIADDHPIVLVGLRMLLQNHCADGQVIGEAHGSAELLALVATQTCDLVITDFSMPAEDEVVDGMGMICQLRERYRRLAIIVLTMSHNPALLKGMLAAGANAVVEKTAMTKELITAIQTVRKGRSYVSEYLRKRLAEHAPVATAQRAHEEKVSVTLSMREAEIMRMLARGMTVTEIAKVTCRSIKTISQQKHDAMRKLCIDSDSQLFEYMRTHGL
jgi:two-component system capsular synthesis response regulator RcsB